MTVPSTTSPAGCKHADALSALGVLPSALLGALQQRSKLLDEAEAMLKETEQKLDAVSARAVQLQIGLAAAQPPQPRPRAVKTQAA